MALAGTGTAPPREMLSRLLVQMQALEVQVAEVTVERERWVACQGELIGRLDTIPGIERITAWTVLAEIGTDLSLFGDAQPLASWAALCPGNRESGGQRRSGKTRTGNRYVRRALCQSAWAAVHQKDCHLAALFRRVRSRRGEQKAILAVAHPLLVILFSVVRDGSVSKELGDRYYERKNKTKAAQRLVQRLQKLGDSVTRQPVEGETLAPPQIASEPAPIPHRKRGRPCQCAERGIPCKHGRVSTEMNSQEIPQEQGVHDTGTQ
jgi:transposase